ncbi:MAG: hypothetical protein VKK04_22075, partial [Synechococcales bacterium]|nr:hypothetical protein [Synechococcales bacterium]
NELIGGGGDDFLVSSGDDVIDGGAGNDDLRGIHSSNIVTGGSGADEFWMTLTSEVSDKIPLITDFSHAEGDKIWILDYRINDVTTTDGFTFNSETGELFLDSDRLIAFHSEVGFSDTFFVPNRDIVIW